MVFMGDYQLQSRKRSEASQVESQGNSIKALFRWKIEIISESYDSPASSSFATGVSGLARSTKGPKLDGTESIRGRTRTLHTLYIINPEEGCYDHTVASDDRPPYGRVAH
jgi:hypothetical protein